MEFKLDEIESKRAEVFRKKHNHKDDFKKENKIAFTGLGHQFTYVITPGGLGNLVSVRCNYCGKTETLTNTDNW